MPVCTCGHDSDSAARFCSDCGRRLLEADDAVLLLDASSGEPTESIVGHQTAAKRWLPLVGVGIALVLCWSAWATLKTSQEEVSDPRTDNDDSAEPVSEEEPPDTQTEQKTQADFSSSDDITSTMTSTQSSNETSTQAPLTANAPLLGANVDYKLLISTSGRPAVLDLNNGAVQHTEGSRVTPIAVSGNWLVFENVLSGLASLPLDDLGDEPTRLFGDRDNIEFANALPTVGPASPGQLWTVAYRRTDDRGSVSPSLQLLDLRTGATIDHPVAGDGLLISSLLGGRYSDEDGGLVTSPAGGIYATTPDGLRLVADGRLITADQTKALVEQCDASFACQRRWLDRSTWQPVDLKVPNEADLLVALPGTDWLFRSTLSEMGPASLFNVHTGETVDLQFSETSNSNGLTLPAVSPDGQWLAEATQDQAITFRNLTTGEINSITLDRPIAGPLFFIQE